MALETSKVSQRSLLTYTIIGLFIITACVCAYKIHINKLPVLSSEETVSGYDINNFTVNFANESEIASIESKTSGQTAFADNSSGIQSTKASDDNSSLVNINIATAEELMKLKGIGEIKAAAIIEYRIENGKYSNISELLNVSGIGQKIFEDIREYITV